MLTLVFPVEVVTLDFPVEVITEVVEVFDDVTVCVCELTVLEPMEIVI